MWCLDNLNWFKLTDEEQAIYDAISIMVKKYSVSTTFPQDILYKYIKDQKSLESLSTPFVYINGYISFYGKDSNHPIVSSVSEYITGYSNSSLTYDHMEGLNHVLNKDAELAKLEGYSNEEIYGGWGTMNDYKD